MFHISIVIYTIIAVSPIRVIGFAFDPSIQHRHQGRILISDESGTSSKCPYSALMKWIQPFIDDRSKFIYPISDSSNNLYHDVNHLSKISLTELMPQTATTTMSKQQNLQTRLETWYMTVIEQNYQSALALKCPFFRRRASDTLELIDSVMRYILSLRSATSGVPPISVRGIDTAKEKQLGLTIEELMTVIRKDWKEESKKGYYVTGRLTPSVYRDDCLFDGPDPDMPVRGIRKYTNAASQLFDYKNSFAELLSLNVEGECIVAYWRFNGTMRLPWRPKLPEVTGTTTYHIDSSGLIKEHIETWDISAFQAFFKTFFPTISKQIYSSV